MKFLPNLAIKFRLENVSRTGSHLSLTRSLKLILVFSLLALNACSVYRSQGRKQLESVEPSSIQGFTLVSCYKQNSVRAWLQAEFPRHTYEIIFSDSDLEILKSSLTDGRVEILATQGSGTGSSAGSSAGPSTCLYRFDSEEIWQLHQSQFVRELENNMMISE